MRVALSVRVGSIRTRLRTRRCHPCSYPSAEGAEPALTCLFAGLESIACAQGTPQTFVDACVRTTRREGHRRGPISLFAQFEDRTHQRLKVGHRHAAAIP